MSSFVDRFFRIAVHHSSFCFGLDPSKELIQSWGFSDNKEGLSSFCDLFLESVEASGGGVIKPQVAFFEAFGPEGMFILKKIILKAKDLGLLVIADGKRGDIGKTSQAYAKAWLGKGFSFQADAITLHPYLGFESLIPFVDLAEEFKRGLFIVLRSSNKAASYLQKAFIFDKKKNEIKRNKVQPFLFREIGLKIQRFSEQRYSNVSVGPIGVVIGGNLSCEPGLLQTIDEMTKSLFLVPGIGAQGGTFENVRKLFGKNIKKVILTSSSDVLKHGPKKEDLIKKMRELIEKTKKLQNF